jgi:hypothetical protein
MPPRKKRPPARASSRPSRKPQAKAKAKATAKPKTKAKPKAKAKPRAKAAPKANGSAKAARAKRAAPAPTPRRSPIYGMTIADFIRDKLTGWQAEAVALLATIIREAAPDAEGTVKWGQPVFELAGPFAYIKPATAHVSLGFWRGAELEDPEGVLEGDGERMRHVKISSLRAIDATILSPLVQRAVLLNREQGSPPVAPTTDGGEQPTPPG